MTTFQIVCLTVGCVVALGGAIMAAASTIDAAIRAAANTLAQESHQHRLQRAALAREERRTILPPPITDNSRITPEAADLIRRTTGRR